jgi:hypothetical protein
MYTYLDQIHRKSRKRDRSDFLEQLLTNAAPQIKKNIFIYYQHLVMMVNVFGFY